MRTLLRRLAITTFSLWITTFIVGSFQINGGLQSIFIAGIVFMLLDLLVKPIIKIILLPINIITLGLARIVVYPLLLFILTKLTGSIAIGPWYFQGLSTPFFDLPAHVFGIILTYIITASILGFLISLLRWL